MEKQTNEQIKIKLERHKWPDEIEAERKKKKGVLVIVVAMLLTFVLGWTFGSVFYASPGKVVQDTNVARFERVYNSLLNNWYFASEMDNPESLMIDNAINGMINLNGDKHTSYMTGDEAQDFNTSIDLDFVGIGVQYYSQDHIITRVFKDSPAEKVGILPGDILTSIDGTLIKDLKAEDDIRDLILGKEGTNVNVGIDRQGQSLKFDVVRGSINALTWGEMLDNNTAYLEISSFGTNLSQSTEVYLKYFKEQNANKLIIDFRDNGGGYLNAINSLSQLFFEDGQTVYFEKLTNGKEVEYKTVGSVASNYKFDKIVVLVNENTASAAEVFALALRDNLNAPIVGTTTYGKGTVQTAMPNTIDNSILKYTMAKWYSPKKESIHEVGIVPDYEVKLPEIFYEQGVDLKDEDVINYDSVHAAVGYAQKGLSFLGYHDGRTDSYYDSATRTALLKFKQSIGLTQNDQINKDVLRKIYSTVVKEWSLNKKTYDNQAKKALEVINK